MTHIYIRAGIPTASFDYITGVFAGAIAEKTDD